MCSGRDPGSDLGDHLPRFTKHRLQALRRSSRGFDVIACVGKAEDLFLVEQGIVRQGRPLTNLLPDLRAQSGWQPARTDCRAPTTLLQQARPVGTYREVMGRNFAAMAMVQIRIRTMVWRSKRQRCCHREATILLSRCVLHLTCRQMTVPRAGPFRTSRPCSRSGRESSAEDFSFANKSPECLNCHPHSPERPEPACRL